MGDSTCMACVTGRRAGLGDEELAHLLLAALHRVGDAQQRARAILARRARPRPLVERAPRRARSRAACRRRSHRARDRLSPPWPDSAPRMSRRSMRRIHSPSISICLSSSPSSPPVCAASTRRSYRTSVARMSTVACRRDRRGRRNLRYDLRPIADSLPSVHCARRTAPDDSTSRLDGSWPASRSPSSSVGERLRPRSSISGCPTAMSSRTRRATALPVAARRLPPDLPDVGGHACRPSPTSTATASPTPSSARTTTRVLAFRNAGTHAAPRWERRAGVGRAGRARGAPALGDLDGDGDADLLVGDADGG